MNILKKINNHYKKTNWLHIKDYVELLEEENSRTKNMSPSERSNYYRTHPDVEENDQDR
jgi:hypothetical protein